MSLHAADIERINFHKHGQETFSVELDQIKKSLTIKVNGEVRNTVTSPEVVDLDFKFEELLKVVKERFIKWREKKH
jgi:hypothetical protein